MERALLVTIEVDTEKDSWRFEDASLELEELVASCGAEVVDTISCKRDRPTPNLFIGKGKAEELNLISFELGIDTVVFSHDLSGTQQRNLEEVIGKKTIDRSQLILDIFAQHAKTPEGKMQVELAQLQYLMPRLVGKGVMLSRLGGGIGTRGPGEQKLEVDRRRIRQKIDRLKQDLKQITRQRDTMRKQRKLRAIPSVALVGYTNAGKSTLLNALTDAGQVVADSLFTTLDPLAKQLQLPNGENIIISDTVGFLHNLPHHLIEAFKATLEEVVQADVLIHVVDASNALVEEHYKAVFQVLKELKVEDKPIITVLNKTDLVSDATWLARMSRDFNNAVALSAKHRQNLESLLKKIEGHFQSRMVILELLLPHKRMDLVDLFYREGQVQEIEYQQDGIKIKVSIPKTIERNILVNKEIKIINENN